MMIKCMAFDMDRTTLNAQGRLSQKNKEALEYAIEKGVHVVIASGRAFSALPEDVMAVKGIAYAITSNGAEVYETKTGQCLKSYCIAKESIHKIMKLTEHMPVTWEVFMGGKAYAGKEYVENPAQYGAVGHTIDYVKRTRTPQDNIYHFIMMHAQKINSIDVIVKDEKQKEILWEQLQTEISDIYMTTSSPQLIEISSKECGKHRGLAFITEYLGLDRSQTAAFGDGDNDAEMLQYAGKGIAVKNASKACLASADMTVADYDKDGVAEGIYRLLG